MSRMSELSGCIADLKAAAAALFSAAVSLLAHRKMKGINMVESLKSVE